VNDRRRGGEGHRGERQLAGTLWTVAAVIAVYELVLFAALRAYAS
jgi:hypothetical protein